MDTYLQSVRLCHCEGLVAAMRMAPCVPRKCLR
eukprot:COSAG06_NODE_47191_length_341_cov_0.636364_1_plen_32_part_10